MSGSPADTLLAADHATRRFGDVVAVDDVSVRVQPGEIVGLLGANGAGKTTLIRMLLGLLAPSLGVVSMFGTTPSRATRKRLGYVSQGLGLYGDMTVVENVDFNAHAFGVRPDQIDLSDDLMALGDRLVRSIGLGRQRQLAFACALGHRPDLLVLDEPTSGVDPLARARLWESIRSQVERNAGVLVTTHYMEEAEQCDRLVLMAAGRVAAAGDVGDIIAGRTVVAVDAASWSEAFTALSDAGYDVMLAGRRLRVVSDDAAAVDSVLRRADLEGSLAVVPATLEEAMVAVHTAR